MKNLIYPEIIAYATNELGLKADKNNYIFIKGDLANEMLVEVTRGKGIRPIKVKKALKELDLIRCHDGYAYIQSGKKRGLSVLGEMGGDTNE